MTIGPRVCSECGAKEGEHHFPGCSYIAAHHQEGKIVLPSPPPTTSIHIALAIPPEVAPYTHEIRRFAEAMIYKLAKHANKGKWEGQNAESMLPLLDGEVKELREALERGNMVEILLEAADVANYGLIISAIVMEKGK